MSYCERHKKQYLPSDNVCLGCHVEKVNAARVEGERKEEPLEPIVFGTLHVKKRKE